MDYFCKACVAKPGWAWDDALAFNHSCQRCFQFRPCNDYGKKKVAPAPQPNEIVTHAHAGHIDVKLPQAKGPTVLPTRAPQSHGPASAAPKNDTDAMLDALQPNRPGIKLEVKKK